MEANAELIMVRITGEDRPGLTASVMEMMQWLKATGHETEDHSSLVRYYEFLADTDVRR